MRYGSVDVLGDQIPSVEQAACHVLAGTGVALDQLIRRVEARAGDFHHCMLLVRCLCAAHHGSISCQREVNSEDGFRKI